MTTAAEMRRAFRSSGLWRMGWTYAKAMTTIAVRKSLICAVRAQRRTAEKTGNPPPDQLGLL
ncbi:MAG: hypothetical protein A3K04_02360 [Gallionellales bacterium RBG_16_56_9]|nr:MAG: hypothetical protein A3K04_02360 [Gallionellales bacterium RBG_16_56_9]